MKHQKLIDRLRELAAGATPFKTHVGICSNVSQFADDLFLKGCFYKIGYESGSYPINSAKEYEFHSENDTLWTGEQGERRRKLCTELANYLCTLN